MLIFKEKLKIKGQIIGYIFVGGTAFVADFSFFYFFFKVLGSNYLLASALSFVAGLTTNYFLGRAFVFSSRKVSNVHKEFFAVFLISFGGMLLTLFLLWLCVEKIGIYAVYSKIIASIVVLAYNFTLRKIVVYH